MSAIGHRLTALKSLLSVVGMALVLTGLVAMFLRVNQLRELAIFWGAENAPDYYLRFIDYGYRTGCFLSVWLGLFFLVCASNPVRFRSAVATCGWGLVVWGVFSAVLGNSIAMPRSVWLVNLISCVAFGFPLLWFNRKPKTNDPMTGATAPSRDNGRQNTACKN